MGKFFPQIAGSSIVSFSSTTRKNGFRASCLCSKILIRSAVTAMVATAASVNTAMVSLRFPLVLGMRILPGERIHPFERWNRNRRRGFHNKGSGRMTHIEVTLNAGHPFVMGTYDCRSDLCMTGAAGALSHGCIARPDFDVIRKHSGGEPPRVIEAVFHFYGVLANEIMRRMTIVTLGDSMMTRFHPRVVILLHHVTVGASGWIAGEVGVSTGINKGVEAEPNHDSKEHG